MALFRLKSHGLNVCLLLLLAAAAAPAQSTGVDDLRREFDQRLQQLRDEQERQLRQADERYRRLEEKYQRLEQRIEGRTPEIIPVQNVEPAAPEAGGEPFERNFQPVEEDDNDFHVPLYASFDEGMRLSSFDDEYQLRIHLLGQTDFKSFVPGDQEPARSGLYIPRFRVYFEGTLTDPVEYELSIQRSVEGTFDVLDADINFHYWDQFQVKFGRFLVPYSYDWYNHLEQWFITPERGLFPLNFGLSREAGLMFWGWLFEHRLEYATGGFDGQLFGLADTNTTRDWVGYVNALPFRRSEEYPLLRFFNFGGSIALGQQTYAAAPLPLRTAVQSSENDEAAQGASPVFLIWNEDVVAQGGRFQGAIHFAWYVNHLSLEGEWQIGAFEYLRGFGFLYPHVTVPVTGFHLAAGYFITGETVEKRTVVQPL
ncbi:MAG: porin, partial [Gemmataceae bacterium]